MNWLSRLLGGKKSATPRTYTARDNKGMRYQDQGHARSTWMATHLTHYTPVVICRFPTLGAAQGAIRQLSYIHEATDTAELITDEVIEFGCYTNEEGQGEVIICGTLLTHAQWQEAREKLVAAGGTLVQEQAPEESVPTPKPKPATSATAAVTFVREYQKGMHTYREYRGPSKAATMAFLQDHPVNRNYYYLIVETPEGNFGRDIDGIYAE